jgi:DNA-binding winged helix-turn-helix (wHTH) protein/tetratricopeptide (TPR) repeat protein
MSATAGSQGKKLYEFGPFRVDVEREILLRSDEVVSVTPKTFQMLLVLLRHGAAGVSKDELMKEVWPDTFVEEANLSRTIFMLRKALGESPKDHRYIVTVPGRGYRLAADVAAIPEQELDLVSVSHSTVQVQVEQGRPWGLISAVVLLILAIAFGAFRLTRHSPRVFTEKDTVVLADFANSTGDPAFEGTLRQGMEVQLVQSPYLSLISDDRIRGTLQLMGRPADTPLTPSVAREICERTLSAAVLEGSIANLGSQYVVGLRAKSCRTGDVLDEEQAQAAKKEDVLNALSQIAVRFRTRVGESGTSVEKHSTPLTDATTSSFEAWKAYTTGLKIGLTTSWVAGLADLKRAVEIDPSFATAHAQLGIVYSDIGETALSVSSTTEAYRLRDRTSERERFFITALYDRQVTGNLDGALQTIGLWEQAYPRDPLPHAIASGLMTQGSGQYRRSIEESRKAIDVDPDLLPAYVNMAYSYAYMSSFAEAENAIGRSPQRYAEFPELLLLRYYLAMFKGDMAGMNREVMLAAGKPGAEDWITYCQALVLARSGQLQKARKMSSRASELAQRSGQRERAATYEAGVAVWEAFFGDAGAARRTATAALADSNGRDVEYAAAFALAVTGDRERTQALAKDLEKRFPEDTSVHYNYLPSLRGLTALFHGDPGQAIEGLQIPAPLEDAVTGCAFFAFFGTLYPAYVRGEAYMASNRPIEAAAEFQRILDRPGLLFADPVGPRARLELGRALAKAGDKSKAKAAYQDFLMLWKDADLDVPILKQAKAEYAELQRSRT